MGNDLAVASRKVQAEEAEDVSRAACIESEYGVARKTTSRDIAPPTRPKTKTRQCTDVCCLFVFLSFLCGMGAVFWYSTQHGDLHKLTQGYDWEGRICGIDEGVTDKPFLYWCAKSEGGTLHLTLGDGICVPQCPNTTEHTALCPDAPKYFHYAVPTSGGDGQEMVFGLKRNLTRRQNYVTAPILGYCFPEGAADETNALVKQIASSSAYSGIVKQVFFAADGILKSKWFLVGVAVCAVIAGYLFLWLLRKAILSFIVALMTATFLFLLALGLYVLYEAWCEPGSTRYCTTEYNLLKRYIQNEHDAKVYGYWTGGVIMFLWLCFTILMCVSCSAIRHTVQAVRASCDAMSAMPTLLLQPLVQVAFQLTALSALLFGFCYVLSLGQVMPNPPNMNVGINAQMEEGYSITGLSRSMQYTGNQKYMIAFWAFGTIWISEFIQAMGQYALSHAVVVYKVKGAAKCLPLTRGYLNAIIFHAGTIAFGSFIIGVLKAITVVLSFLAKQLSGPPGSDGKPNVVGKILAVCLICCMSCLIKVMELVNDLVYTDVAIRGNGYCNASRSVYACLALNVDTWMILEYTTFGIRWLGLLIIGGGGTWISYKLATDGRWTSAIKSVEHMAGEQFPIIDGYGSVTSLLDHSHALGTTLASAIVCFTIAQEFMMVFDMTAQALCYVDLWKKEVSPDGWDEPKKEGEGYHRMA